MKTAMKTAMTFRIHDTAYPPVEALNLLIIAPEQAIYLGQHTRRWWDDHKADMAWAAVSAIAWSIFILACIACATWFYATQLWRWLVQLWQKEEVVQSKASGLDLSQGDDLIDWAREKGFVQ